MSREDWLVPIDDGLRGWPHRCTLCGGQQGTKGWWDIFELGRYAVAVMICGPCRQRDPQRQALRALLEQRYRQEPMQTGADRCEDTAKN